MLSAKRAINLDVAAYDDVVLNMKVAERRALTARRFRHHLSVLPLQDVFVPAIFHACDRQVVTLLTAVRVSSPDCIYAREVSEITNIHFRFSV